MAKHRAGRRSARTRRIRQAVPPVVMTSAVVVTVATAGGVAVVEPERVASTMYNLSALIVEGSSTNPTGAGVADFYQGAFAQGRDVVTVNFLTGPFGIYDALAENADDDDNVVMSSGWGAANASLLLSYLAATGADDPVATNAVYVLDNNVARPNGGFGTRYPVFAAIGVNPLPTPTAPGVQVIDVGYEYDINGNTPAYVLNGVAMANSLMAYFDRRLNQDDLDLPVSIDADGQVVVREGCEVRCLTEDGWVRVHRVGDTTYVSYEAEHLPLTRPLRQFGAAGARIADAIDPALRAIIDYGYPNNDPLADPGTYRPVGLLPSLRETQKFAEEFTAGLRAGLNSLDGADDRTRRDQTVVADDDDAVAGEALGEGAPDRDTLGDVALDEDALDEDTSDEDAVDDEALENDALDRDPHDEDALETDTETQETDDEDVAAGENATDRRQADADADREDADEAPAA